MLPSKGTLNLDHLAQKYIDTMDLSIGSEIQTFVRFWLIQSAILSQYLGGSGPKGRAFQGFARLPPRLMGWY